MAKSALQQGKDNVKKRREELAKKNTSSSSSKSSSSKSTYDPNSYANTSIGNAQRFEDGLRYYKDYNDKKFAEDEAAGKHQGMSSGYSGGGYSGGSAYSSYERAMREAMEAQQRAAQQRADGAINRVEGQRVGITDSATQAAQQAYINREKSTRDMGQQLAALGLSGGAAESTLLGIGTNFENSRNDIIRDRDAGYRELDLRKEDIRTTLDASLADVESQYALSLAQQLAQQQAWEQQRQAQLADMQTQRDWALSDYDRNRQDSLADTQAERAYQQQLAAQRAAGSGGTSSSKPRLTAAQAMSALENGYDTPEIQSALQYYYGNVYGGAAAPQYATVDPSILGNLPGGSSATNDPNEYARRLAQQGYSANEISKIINQRYW